MNNTNSRSCLCIFKCGGGLILSPLSNTERSKSGSREVAGVPASAVPALRQAGQWRGPATTPAAGARVTVFGLSAHVTRHPMRDVFSIVSRRAFLREV
jgi:hypothetical protein